MGWRSEQSYSQDLRDRVLGTVDSGMAIRTVAATFGVSIAYIYKTLMRRRLPDDAGINPNRGHKSAQALARAVAVAGGAHALSTGHHAGAGTSLAAGRAWSAAQHRRDLERGASIWPVVQKSPARGRAGSPRSRRQAQSCGERRSRSSTLKASSSSTRRASLRRWRGCMAGRRSASGAVAMCRLGTGKP